MATINSSRVFTLVYLESDFTYSNPVVTMDEIFKDDDIEWKYALHENIDSLLDLKPGERLQMNFNRDNQDSAGFIKRIK